MHDGRIKLVSAYARISASLYTNLWLFRPCLPKARAVPLGDHFSQIAPATYSYSRQGVSALR